MEEVGLGQIKEANSAIRKADRKYGNDLLKVTDYCRGLIVVRDFSSLLALYELAKTTLGPLVRRIKLSSLKRIQEPIAGGYRDCKINIELNGHICELQVHLWPMWTICGIDSFRHYRHCLEYKTDTFADPHEALEGLDRKALADMIVLAEEEVADHPLSELEWYKEKYIIDYYAEVGLFMHGGDYAWAEVTLRHLIKLRTVAKYIGPYHSETMLLQKYLARALNKQGKTREENEIKRKIQKYERRIEREYPDSPTTALSSHSQQQKGEPSLWESFYTYTESVFDPNKEEREFEERQEREVRRAKQRWMTIRREKFSFLLDGDNTNKNGGEIRSSNKLKSITTTNLHNTNKNSSSINKHTSTDVHSTASTVEDDDSIESITLGNDEYEGEDRSLITETESMLEVKSY